MNEFSRSVAESMNQRRSQWEMHGPMDDGSVDFSLRPPSEGSWEIVLSTRDDELTLKFALAHWHVRVFGETGPIDGSVAKALEIADAIQAERILAVEGRKGRFVGKFGGFIEVPEFEHLASKGRIQKAVSWRGTYAI